MENELQKAKQELEQALQSSGHTILLSGAVKFPDNSPDVAFVSLKLHAAFDDKGTSYDVVHLLWVEPDGKARFPRVFNTKDEILSLHLRPIRKATRVGNRIHMDLILRSNFDDNLEYEKSLQLDLCKLGFTC